MWYLIWFIGLSLAVSLSVLYALWLEQRFEHH